MQTSTPSLRIWGGARMNFDELIAQHCPKGIELKYLWEITVWDKRFNGIAKNWQPQVLSFNHVSAAKLKQLKIPDGDVKLLSTGKFGGVTSIELAGDNLNEGEVIAIPSGGSASLKYFNGKFVDSGNILCSSKDNAILSLKYLYHYLLNINNLIEDLFRGPGVKHPSMPSILQLRIPVPPIKIQQEIVRILDAFTSLTAELTAELTARKKQYNYYRDQLLTFSDDVVTWKPLDDVCSSISAGGDLPENYAKDQANPSEEFPYPIYTNATGDNGLYGFTDGYKIESDAVTISARGTIGYHTVREGKFTPIIRLITLVPNKNIISTRYLNYILDVTPIGGTDGGIPQLTVPTVKKISIPVPPVTEQARIVDILDKFDALTNSISEGLPHEIELRQKQYEYYRDLLLNFPKPEEVAA